MPGPSGVVMVSSSEVPRNVERAQSSEAARREKDKARPRALYSGRSPKAPALLVVRAVTVTYRRLNVGEGPRPKH